MEIIIISIVSFLAAILTFFSGFGLGTILTPVMMVFFPVELAIGLTAVVHFFNNIFKLILVGKYGNLQVILRFGIPAVLAAILGSYLLIHISDLQPIYSYNIGSQVFEISPVKLIISILLIIFASIDLIPYFGKLQFGKEKLPVGGMLSGFFGGLSGNQGALRSAFLIKAGLSKEAFIGTAVIVSISVDFTRLFVYSTKFSSLVIADNWFILTTATLSAIIGAYIGNQLLKKVTVAFIQKLVAVMLILISIALATGFL
jgi:uncharacterized membrane protein YfcA